MNKHEIEALISKAEMSIRAARLLVGVNMNDFAASRAYYAMFYLAEVLLLSKGLTFSSHSAVISAFGQHFSRTKTLDPRFHRYLIDSFGLRQKGDYDTTETTAESARMTILWAEEFLAVAKNYLATMLQE